MNVFLTGAGGFVGAHVLSYLLEKTDWAVTVTDSPREKSRNNRLTTVMAGHPGAHRRVTVLAHDLMTSFSDTHIAAIGNPDVVIAMASKTGISESITEPASFIRGNVDIMLTTLEVCRMTKPRVVIIISTDEVYGPAEAGSPHGEWDAILPPSPYAASKAAQEAVAISYWRTYGVPVIIANCMNPIGEMQGPGKFVPTAIRKVLRDERLTIYGTPDDVSTRRYIHARNLADAILFLVNTQPPRLFGDEDGEVTRPDRYNIGGEVAISNEKLAQAIARTVGKTLEYKMASFDSARPGHDPHYGLDISKLLSLGWQPPVEFWESVERTVRWTLNHPEWIAA